MGQRITTLVNETQAAGLYQVEWNGCNQSNNLVPGGIYFYRISVRTGNNELVLSRKMVLRK